MEKFRNEDGKVVVLNLISTIQENKDYLSEVDGLIGDGDHGINMNKGFTSCGEKLKDVDTNLSESLKILGQTLLTEIGGSMGPLYSTMFRRMARRCRDEEYVDAQVFKDMIVAAKDGVSELGNAKPGDKTLMDVLVPAADKYSEALDNGAGFTEALQEMKKAAQAGMESTKDMVAKVGRSSRLGERSRGVLDAGAVSCNLLLQSMADTIIQLINS